MPVMKLTHYVYMCFEAVSNIVRFEQKGLVSLKKLIAQAMAIDYTYEVKNIFSQPKYSTMEELTEIRKKHGKKPGCIKKGKDKTERKQV